MEEEKGGGDSSRVSTSFVEAGDRQRFTVELRPGETTIVSWKKLIKDATKVNGSTSAPEPPSNANPALESRIAPDSKLAASKWESVIQTHHKFCRWKKRPWSILVTWCYVNYGFNPRLVARYV